MFRLSPLELAGDRSLRSAHIRGTDELRASAAGRLRPARLRKPHPTPPRLPPPNRKTERTPIAAPDPQPPASAADSEQNLPLPRTAKTHPSGPYRKKPGRVINNSHRIIRFSAQRAPLRGRKLSTITVTFHCTEQCRRPQLLKTHKGMQNKYLTIKNPLSEAEKTPYSDCSQLGSRPATFNKRPSPNEKLSTIQ